MYRKWRSRYISSWGNGEKVEITGMPRMDALLNRSFVKRGTYDVKRILVMTAKKPWFDESQRRLFYEITD